MIVGGLHINCQSLQIRTSCNCWCVFNRDRRRLIFSVRKLINEYGRGNNIINLRFRLGMAPKRRSRFDSRKVDTNLRLYPVWCSLQGLAIICFVPEAAAPQIMLQTASYADDHRQRQLLWKRFLVRCHTTQCKA